MNTTLCDQPEARDPSSTRALSRADRLTQIPEHRLSDSERGQVYDDLQPLVRRLIRQFGDTSEMRRELAGEIYCRFCQLLEEYDPGRGIALYPYLLRKLYTSTYAYARTQWRLQTQRERHEVSWEDQEEAGVQIGVEWDDPVEGWINRSQQAEALSRLKAAIEGLSERQRQVVIWRYYEGKSFDEIATLQENKAATVRSHLRHALKSLRAQMSVAPLYSDDEK